MMSSSSGVFTGLILALFAILFMYVAYLAGQLSIIDSCEKASFFYSHGLTFECLPYTKGMLNERASR